ncbi:MAG: DUF2817 domain-containing protein [Bacteroidetes bacterium]|nr:DUF2817 domain-containing protein [Bacteroidota bacterium]
MKKTISLFTFLIIGFCSFAQSYSPDSVIKSSHNYADTLLSYRNFYNNSTKSNTISIQHSDTLSSENGRNIDLYSFGKADSCIFIIGGIHGNEPSGIELAGIIINYLKLSDDQKFKYKVLVMPIANPDGVALNTRQNANGVDLNRNWDTKNFKEGKLNSKKGFYGGKMPFSERETRNIKSIIDFYKPFLIITLHAPYQCINYDGPAYSYAKLISNLMKFPIKSDLGYKIYGSLGIYYGLERNIPVVTVELPAKTKQWELYKLGLLKILGSK